VPALGWVEAYANTTDAVDPGSTAGRDG